MSENFCRTFWGHLKGKQQSRHLLEMATLLVRLMFWAEQLPCLNTQSRVFRLVHKPQVGSHEKGERADFVPHCVQYEEIIDSS
jgi:hypothetical protein